MKAIAKVEEGFKVLPKMGSKPTAVESFWKACKAKEQLNKPLGLKITKGQASKAEGADQKLMQAIVDLKADFNTAIMQSRKNHRIAAKRATKPNAAASDKQAAKFMAIIGTKGPITDILVGKLKKSKLTPKALQKFIKRYAAIQTKMMKRKAWHTATLEKERNKAQKAKEKAVQSDKKGSKDKSKPAKDVGAHKPVKKLGKFLLAELTSLVKDGSVTVRNGASRNRVLAVVNGLSLKYVLKHKEGTVHEELFLKKPDIRKLIKAFPELATSAKKTKTRNASPVKRFLADLEKRGYQIKNKVVTVDDKRSFSIVEHLDTDRIVVNINGRQTTTTFSTLIKRFKLDKDLHGTTEGTPEERVVDRGHESVIGGVVFSKGRSYIIVHERITRGRFSREYSLISERDAEQGKSSKILKWKVANVATVESQITHRASETLLAAAKQNLSGFRERKDDNQIKRANNNNSVIDQLKIEEGDTITVLYSGGELRNEYVEKVNRAKGRVGIERRGGSRGRKVQQRWLDAKFIAKNVTKDIVR